MPGVLIRSDSLKTMNASKLALGEREPTTEDSGFSTVQAQPLTNGLHLVNGDNGLPNGIHVDGVPFDLLEGQNKPAEGVDNLLNRQLPPEILHITQGYVPLSHLFSRLAQDTFNSLTDVVNELSEYGPASTNNNSSNSSSQVNGLSNGGPLDGNSQKKLRILEFAQHRREQFIKALVLSQWSRQAEQVGKCIDLKVWLDTQRRTYNDAVGWVGELKRAVEHTKMPNPDLKTALEALSLGKASWLPDLRYLPPKHMSAQDLLKALRRINTLLSIRLNIHDNIPLPFRNFSIASGRATFRVKTEFELDLSLANEELSSQLFFVDLRFLFSPGLPELPASRLRDHIEFKVNEILKRDGLAGCFDFLHDFVLTHKISILRHQAYEMLKGHWSDHIKVEAVHRSLVVQYWIQRSGGKNWIEIGIRKGKSKIKSEPTSVLARPQISLRWFRAGKEVADVPVKLDLGALSLAGLLNQIIAMHTSFILKETTARLKGSALYSERVLKLKQSSSNKQAVDAVLFVQLTSKRAVKVVQEPVTGRFAFLPANHLNSRTEREINGSANPAMDSSSRIANLRCVAAQEDFEMHARNSGWESVRSLKLDRETMQQCFPLDTVKINFFRKKAWSSDWLLALTTSLMGDALWVVQTMERKPTVEIPSVGLSGGHTIRIANKLPATTIRAHTVDTSFAHLALIECTAVGMISQYLNIRQLTMNGVPHRLEPPTSAGPGLQSSSLHIYLPPSKASTALQLPSRINEPWRDAIVSLDCRGIDPPTSSGIHIATSRMQKAISNIKELTSNLSSTIAFHPEGGAFAFRLTTPVGTTTIPLLLHRISTIERLIQFLTIIRHHKLPCNILSLTRLSFTYSSQPKMSAIIDFAPDNAMRLSLDAASPHLRIQDALTSILRSPEGGLAQVLVHLKITSPLLWQLSTIEASHGSDTDSVDVLPRSAEWYELRYHNPKGRIDILLRNRQDAVRWYIRHLPSPKDEAKNTALETGMKELLAAKGKGWEGLRTGIAATVSGIGELLQKIDMIFQVAKTTNPSSAPEAPPSDTPKIKEQKKQSPLNPRKRKAEHEVVELD